VTGKFHQNLSINYDKEHHELKWITITRACFRTINMLANSSAAMLTSALFVLALSGMCSVADANRWKRMCRGRVKGSKDGELAASVSIFTANKHLVNVNKKNITVFCTEAGGYNNSAYNLTSFNLTSLESKVYEDMCPFEQRDTYVYRVPVTPEGDYQILEYENQTNNSNFQYFDQDGDTYYCTDGQWIAPCVDKVDCTCLDGIVHYVVLFYGYFIATIGFIVTFLYICSYGTAKKLGKTDFDGKVLFCGRRVSALMLLFWFTCINLIAGIIMLNKDEDLKLIACGSEKHVCYDYHKYPDLCYKRQYY